MSRKSFGLKESYLRELAVHSLRFVDLAEVESIYVEKIKNDTVTEVRRAAAKS